MLLIMCICFYGAKIINSFQIGLCVGHFLFFFIKQLSTIKNNFVRGWVVNKLFQ